MAGANVYRMVCKGLLTKSGIPSIDYAANPYFGCEHGCTYCYATFMLKFHEAPGEWGSFVGVKENAPDVLAREVRRKKPGVVSFGTVCDAYQPAEASHRVTRACLEAFAGVESFEVGVLTKSDLVVRDGDVLERIPRARVGFSITTLDERLARAFEPGAPPPGSRLLAMKALAARGIPVWGFLGPVLPTFSDSEEAVRGIFRAMRDAGAGHVLVDTMNMYPSVWGRVRALVTERFPERLPGFEVVRKDRAGYEADLIGRVRDAARSAGIEAETCF